MNSSNVVDMIGSLAVIASPLKEIAMNAYFLGSLRVVHNSIELAMTQLPNNIMEHGYEIGRKIAIVEQIKFCMEAVDVNLSSINADLYDQFKSTYNVVFSPNTSAVHRALLETNEFRITLAIREHLLVHNPFRT